MKAKIETAEYIIERINERSMQKYELLTAGKADLLKSWALYVEDLRGDNRGN